MHMSAANADDFVARMSMVDLGLLAFVRQHGSPHRCYQEKRDAARATRRTYHLIVNLSSSWNIAHRGALHMEPGDVTLVDSALPWDIHSPSRYEYLNVTLTEAWVRQWLPAPGALTGRRIGGSSGWGRALAAFVSQMFPESIVDLPLPQSLVVDHIGALLAMSAGDLAGLPADTATPALKALDSRIEEGIEQRCTEPTLNAEQVATSVGVLVRTLHRCLAARHKSFGALLIAARAELGMQMLRSPMLRRLTIAEITRRAGFSDPSHFVRVVRSRTGRTPSQLRAGTGDAAADEEPR